MLPAISFWQSGCTGPVTPHAFTVYCFCDQRLRLPDKTWHPSCHAADFRQEIEAGFTHTQWLGLTVFESSPGSHDDEGFVSFVARFTENNKPGAIIERSRFLKESGQWYYIDGTRPQFGRNDPCPCGSGKKFKKCCGQ